MILQIGPRSSVVSAALNGILVRFSGPNADHTFEIGDKNFAVADFPGVRRLDDGIDCRFEQAFLDRDFQAYLGQEVDRVFAAAIELSVPLLPAISLGIADRDAGYADLGQCFAHLV